MTLSSKTISYDNRVRLFWGLVSICILSLVLYVYAVNATARNIAVIQGLEKEVARASGSLSSLEFAYIELKNNVTLDLAYQYGFKEEKQPLYISRTKASTLSFNTLGRR